MSGHSNEVWNDEQALGDPYCPCSLFPVPYSLFPAKLALCHSSRLRRRASCNLAYFKNT